MMMKDSMETKVRQTQYYRDAMKTLRAHDGAKHLLGEPIKDKGVNIGDSENYVDGFKAYFKVKIFGPKDSGVMYFWADRAEVKEPWILKRIELELKSQPDKRLVVKKEDESK